MATTRRELLRDGAAAAAALAASGTLGGIARAAATPAPAGWLKGFTSLTDEVHLPDLPVEGEIPRWLTGTLLRNGPALFEIGPQTFNHWFDGLAMLHAFAFTRGRVAYRNRFLRSSAYDAWKQEGIIKYSEFATNPCRAIFNGASTLPVLGAVPNANVSIERLAGRFRAHTEIPIPVRFDPRSLATLGPARTGVTSTMGTAHPHQDPRTGERFSYELELAPPSGLRVVVEKGGRRRELVFLPDAAPGYLHSFALTPRWVAVFTQPWNFNLGKFLSPDRGPIATNFEWHADKPSVVHLVDRARGGVAAKVELDPFFVFHHVNAFERGGKVLLDVCAHKDAGIVDALYLKQLRKPGNTVPQATLKRIEVDPSRRKATVRRLADGNLELPRTDYARVNQHAYRYAYGVGVKDARRSGFLDQVVKVDVRSGERRAWGERGAYPSEPIFVRRPGARREDDGVLLSVVLDGGRRASSLLVLDARSLDEVGRATVPHHVPFGFHGIYA